MVHDRPSPETPEVLVMNDYEEDWDEGPKRSTTWDSVFASCGCALLVILIVIGVCLYVSLTVSMPNGTDDSKTNDVNITNSSTP